MRHPYCPPTDLPSFQKLMASIGAEEKPSAFTPTQAQRLMRDIGVIEQPPPEAMMFVAHTEAGKEICGIFLEDHVLRVGYWIMRADYWQRKYGNLQAGAWIVATALVVLAVVRWIS